MTAPTPSVRSASERAILLAALKDAVGKAYEAGRRQAIEEMDRAGSLKQGVTSDDGTALGTISHADGKWVAEVDEAVIRGWCSEHRPGEVVQLAPQRVVRPAFIEWLAADAVRRASAGAGHHPIDMSTGTEQKIPGVRAVWKPGNVTVTANQTAKERAAGILTQVFERGLPALNGETNEQQHNPAAPSAVDRGPDGPVPERTDHQRVMDRLRRITAGPSDGADGGTDPGPGTAGPVVPRPAGGGDGGPQSAGEELAGGLLGAVAANAQSYRERYRLGYGLPDGEPEPDADYEPASVTHAEPVDFDQPAPF